ncbi:DUF1801 domain-containing protein [Fibrella forsythiae]|uniref:DUF1801 domain-containing protein n=1 Tax=Fibrella forsythiae TaxID=2817061 RepID=A0ABS3JV07_9BACT|nr:DUF1801 domain-containing protein [Fibrella forsythiae]MBO0952742.1 DUF1801 domain-containing protein [Fibrella forsythiae]
MATTNKTIETSASVTDFISSVADDTKRADCFQLIELIEKRTGLPARMWGSAIVGFGTYHYRYETGREGDMPLVGFSPRSNAIVFYLSLNAEAKADWLQRLGKHKTGKSCIYIKKLSDVDLTVLTDMITASANQSQAPR